MTNDLGTRTESVRDYIISAIVRGDLSPGDQLPPERKMMEIADASRITVRRAYESLANEGVVRIRHGSGAYVSEVMRGHRGAANTIAMLGTLSDVFSLEFIDAVERAVRKSDSYLVLRQTEQDPRREREAAEQLWGLGVRNFVVWPSGTEFDSSFFLRLRVLGCNMVFFDRMSPGPYADFVGPDNDHALESIIDDAQARGVSRITFVSYESKPWTSFLERERAFHRLCAERKLIGSLVRVPWHDEASHILDGHTREIMPVLRKDEAYKALKKMSRYLLTDGSGTHAAIGVNDYVALQIKAVFPDYLVYGIDGLPEAIDRGIISYRHSMVKIAHAAIEMLHRQMQIGESWTASSTLVRGALVLPAK